MQPVSMMERFAVQRALVLLIGLLYGCGQPAAPVQENTAPAAAQKPAAEPCASAETQAAMTQCWGAEAAAAEQRAAAAYDDVLNWLRERQQGAVAEMFRTTQERWESYRDAYCETVAAVYDEGSMAGLQRTLCRYRLAGARARELETVISDANN